MKEVFKYKRKLNKSLISYILKDGGLGIIHVKSKATALLIKNILEDAKVNLYVNAVIRRYCEDEDLSPIPVRPPFLSEGLISCIKYVKENAKQFDSKTIYRALLLREFDLYDGFKLKAEERNRNFKENAVRIINSKMLSVSVRSFLWKFVHNISYLETDTAKIDRTSVKCRLCLQAGVEREHLMLTCNHLNGVGVALMKTLHVFNPRYTEKDVLMIDLDPEIPQVEWFIANALFYISKNRENCTRNKIATYLMSTLETFARSRFCDADMKLSIQVVVETFLNFM